MRAYGGWDAAANAGADSGERSSRGDGLPGLGRSSFIPDISSANSLRHGKTLGSTLMRPYFTRERFGRPQFLAGLLLLAFLGQAVWLVHAELQATEHLDSREAIRIGEGWKQLHGKGIAGAPLTEPADEFLRDPFQSNNE